MRINLSSIIVLLIFIFAIFSGVINYRSAWFVQDKHFSLLAQSFINNDLFLSSLNLPNGDFADFNARQYIFYGPMPSLILVPAVFIFGKNFPQMTLSIISLIIIYITTSVLLRKLKFSEINSYWLANFFVFGTVLYFTGLVNISAYIAQVVGVAFIMLALLVYFSKKSWLLIGTLIAAAGLTRITLYGAIIFFLWQVLSVKGKNFKRHLLLLLLPIIASVLLLGFYNNRRFHSPFETGYSYNVTLETYPLNTNLDYGLFSWRHIPANLYALLLKGPEPIKEDRAAFILKFPYLKVDGWGLAILFTSPVFIYLFRTRRVGYTVPAIVTAIILLTPSLFYFGIGFSQFGYRYSLDFLPFLFLLLIPAFSKDLPLLAKYLIIIGIIFNCLYMLSIWNYYPVFELLKLL